MECSFAGAVQRIEEKMATEAELNSRRQGQGIQAQAQMATIMTRLMNRLDEFDERSQADRATATSELDNRGSAILHQG